MKTKAKICVMLGAEEFDPENRKMVGMLGAFCWRDLLEECPNWAKRLKNPVVDLGALSGLCAARVMDFIGTDVR